VIRRIALLVMLVTSASIGALEFGGDVDLGNWAFARDRVSVAETLAGGSVSWGGHVFVQQELGPVTISLDILIDPVLRSYVSATVSHVGDYFSIAAGPVLGVDFADGLAVRPAVLSSVGLFAPGRIFAELTSIGTFGYRSADAGRFVQEHGQIRAGFYCRNAIPAAFVTRDRFRSGTGADQVVDTRSRFGAEAALFEKNVPYNVTIFACYQEIRMSFGDPLVADHGTGSIVAGLNATITLFRKLALRLLLEGSIYTFGTADLFGEAQGDTSLLRGSIGVAYRL
jgi:hypothetical protein